MGWIELPEEPVMKFSTPGSRWRMIFDAASLVYLIVKVVQFASVLSPNSSVRGELRDLTLICLVSDVTFVNCLVDFS